MRIGGRTRLWLALAGMLLALGLPAHAAPSRGQLVLRGQAGGTTVSLPAGLRLVVPETFTPAPSGRVRGFVLREASSGELVLAALTLDLPGFDRVRIFRRGQGYEDGRLPAGRYRFSLLGDARNAKDIVIPIEGLRGSRVLKLDGGSYSSMGTLSDRTGRAASYRLGTFEVFHPMGLIWAWAVKRGTGMHNVAFCMVPKGDDCPPQEGLALDLGPKSYSGVHLSAPSTRPTGKYDLVLNTNSVGDAGPVAMVGMLFL
ncbi:MAG TPA: hypothetical protein VNA14_13485 [Mycobacteriales bacterium]|nr:hypothetical protein [Mycobacteriales bacterium]